jgi:hypothetical protein
LAGGLIKEEEEEEFSAQCTKQKGSFVTYRLNCVVSVVDTLRMSMT